MSSLTFLFSSTQWVEDTFHTLALLLYKGVLSGFETRLDEQIMFDPNTSTTTLSSKNLNILKQGLILTLTISFLSTQVPAHHLFLKILVLYRNLCPQHPHPLQSLQNHISLGIIILISMLVPVMLKETSFLLILLQLPNLPNVSMTGALLRIRPSFVLPIFSFERPRCLEQISTT